MNSKKITLEDIKFFTENEIYIDKKLGYRVRYDNDYNDKSYYSTMMLLVGNRSIVLGTYVTWKQYKDYYNSPLYEALYEE